MFPLGEVVTLLPIAVIGLWRWGNWFMKVFLSWRYEPYDAVVVDHVPGVHVAAEGIRNDGGQSAAIFGLVAIAADSTAQGRLLRLHSDPTRDDPLEAKMQRSNRVLKSAYEWIGKVGLMPPPEESVPDQPTVATEQERPLSVSVVTPVYDADPRDFIATVQTWNENDPDEIIAVIDAGDTDCIRAFRQYADRYDHISCIVTPKPGKRPALRDGAKVASGDIIALVDDDVRWRECTLTEFLKPFADYDVGAVSCKQTVQEKLGLAQELYEIKLRLDYGIDSKVLSLYGSQAVVSGRTAVYRRNALLPIIDELPQETFLNKQVISGDDKFLTRAVQREGWRAVYQSTSPIDIQATASFETFIKQTIRWTRNTVRSDLKSYVEGWVFDRRILSYYYADRFVGNFAILFAPLFFVVALSRGALLVGAAVLVWWLLSRTFKMMPYLRLYADWVSILPFYIVASFLQSPVYLYALFSANTQGWMTRGDDSRYGFGIRQKFVSGVSVALTFLTLGGFLYAAYTIKY